MILFLAIVFLGSAVFFLGEVVTAPSRERRSLLTRAAQYGRMRVSHGRELTTVSERALAPLVARLSGLMLKAHPQTNLRAGCLQRSTPGPRSTCPSALL